MNYIKTYNNLIETRRNTKRTKGIGEIYESHHIIPKCLGGSDEPDNLVLLTPREHFIAHMLLWKNDRSNYKLFAPLLYFKKSIHVINSRTYEEIRIIHTKFMISDNPSKYLSEESKISKSKKLSEYAKNRTPEHNKKISEAKLGLQTRLGAILTEESKSKISSSLFKYFKEVGVSDETRRKISESNTGKKHTEETIGKCSRSAKNRKKYICPICKDKQLDGGNNTQHMQNKHNYSKEQILSEREGWVAPSHIGNHGLLTDIFNETGE